MMKFDIKLDERQIRIISALLNEEYEKQCDGQSEMCRLGDSVFFNLMTDINTILNYVNIEDVKGANKYIEYRNEVRR